MLQGYSILTYSFSYLLFFGLLWLSKEKGGNRLVDERSTAGNQSMLIVLHTGGILLFGILSYYSLNCPLADIVFGKNTASYFQISMTSLLVIMAVVIAPILVEKKYTCAKARSAGTSSFSTGFIVNYFFVRILFLCVYETWFRGYLLTDSIESWGIIVATLINLILYTLLHAVNGRDEMLVCIPFGLLLCSLCIWVGAAWPAIVLHIAFTLAYETHLVKKIKMPQLL
jgi:membrane protease YdiL (CAAX protease family)